ncbi:MAG: 30S ribosomal protein S15 [Elusimicrobiota bacterium]|nr:30S ribosomal protein S15 [Endomicrobiia bacterium]MCX7910510.1 30S ribosomal protein S15 [Endomicrobiia bacterium]MDW8166068.1 30S ribosomal protein S15 [Elusimicrobiota bacterium]
MTLTKEKIKEIIAKYGKNEKDSGSTEVQIVLLTERINNLLKHFSIHKKDFLTRRNFLRLIGKRKRLLKYLKETNPERYSQIIKEIGLE